MALLHIRERFQVTLPVKVRKDMGIKVGDVMEAVMEDNVLVLKPKTVVKKRQRSAAGKKWEEMLVKSHREHPLNMTEEEVIQATEETRQELFQEKYASILPKNKQ